MKKLFIIALGIAVLLGIGIGPAAAVEPGPITSIGDMPPDHVLIDFESFAEGTPEPITDQDVTISTTWGNLTVNTVGFTQHPGIYQGKSFGWKSYATFNIVFDTPVQEFGMGIFDPNYDCGTGGPTQYCNVIRIYDENNNLLETFTGIINGGTGGSHSSFVGFVREQDDIARVEYQAGTGDWQAIDMIRFYRPPPVTFDVTLYDINGSPIGTGWLTFKDDLEVDTFYRFGQLFNFEWAFYIPGFGPWNNETGDAGYWDNVEGFQISGSAGNRILTFLDYTGCGAEFFGDAHLVFVNPADAGLPYDSCSGNSVPSGTSGSRSWYVSWVGPKGESYTAVERTSGPLGPLDSDDDGILDDTDSCLFDADNDADGDGICGDVDNCPAVANADQEDADEDGLGDACDDCPYDADNDADGDGVCGDVDECSGTEAGATVDSEGCSIAQICPCENDWKNHGKYVSCVAHAAEVFLEAGLITTEAEKDAIVSTAAKSDCGKKANPGKGKGKK